MAKVYLESLTEKGLIWKIDKFPFKIGRAKDNDLVINCIILEDNRAIKDYISKYHAEINNCKGIYTIKDLKSTNGTYLNEIKIMEETSLKNGDIINLSTCYNLIFQTNETPTGDITEQLSSSHTISTV